MDSLVDLALGLLKKTRIHVHDCCAGDVSITNNRVTTNERCLVCRDTLGPEWTPYNIDGPSAQKGVASGMVGAPMAIWRKSAFTSLMSTSTSMGCSPGLDGQRQHHQRLRPGTSRAPQHSPTAMPNFGCDSARALLSGPEGGPKQAGGAVK